MSGKRDFAVYHAQRTGSDTDEPYRFEDRRTSGRPTTVAPALSLMDLAPREREAMALILGGATIPETAEQMGIHRANVSSYLGNARRKVGVATTPELAAWALQFVPPVIRPRTRRAYYLDRFAPLPARAHAHRRGCLCSVCFVTTKDTRRLRR